MSTVSGRTDTAGKNSAFALPALREDLRLLTGPSLADGSPTWTLHDPVRHRFFRIGRLEFEFLSRWSVGHADAIVARVNAETRLEATVAEVDALVRFLLNHRLASPTDPRAAEKLRTALNRPPRGLAGWLLRNYLYIRIPLVRPDRFLERLLPWVRPLGSRPALFLYMVAGLTGLWLAGRQWESFLHTFTYFFNPTGILVYAGAVLAAKLVHELGHGFTAKHHGLSVPTMGVALVVLWPMLYTDNAEAWKLAGRRQRMTIVAAGAGAELALASLATLGWSFLPDGPFRSVAFVLATVTWIGSVALNLSPFMRFDGYYLLSDFLDVPNLQERAFALGRWRLRRAVLGLPDPPPERFAPARQRLLVLYALATWIYRLVVFTTIALMVYHLFFKALGLLLFAVELAWFVAAPLARELGAWWRLRSRLRFNGRLAASLVLGVALLAALLLPGSGAVTLPALARPAHVRIYPPFGARVVSVHVKEGDWVQAGAVLFRLDAPSLRHRLSDADMRVRALRTQLTRLGTDAVQAQRQHTVEEELARALTEVQGLRRRIAQLTVRAAMTGRVTDMTDGLHAGRWIHGRQLLAVVADPGRARITAFARENQLAALGAGQTARFYFEGDAHPPLDGLLESIDPAAVRTLSEPYLASVYGGDLPVHATDRGLKLHESVYGVSLKLSATNRLPLCALRGKARILGRPRSPMGRLLRAARAVIIRESGF